MGSLPPPRDWSVTAAKARSIPTARMPTRYGMFVVQVLTDGNGIEHVALVKGTPANGCLVRFALRMRDRRYLRLIALRLPQPVGSRGVVIYRLAPTKKALWGRN